MLIVYILCHGAILVLGIQQKTNQTNISVPVGLSLSLVEKTDNIEDKYAVLDFSKF